MSEFDISSPPPMGDEEFHAMADNLQKMSIERFAEANAKIMGGKLKRIHNSTSPYTAIRDIFSFVVGNKTNIHNAIVLSAGIADAAVRGDAVSFFRGFIAIFARKEAITVAEIEVIMGKGAGRQCVKFLSKADAIIGGGVKLLPLPARNSVTTMAAILSNPGPWVAQYSGLANSTSTISRLVGNDLRDKLLNAMVTPSEEAIAALGPAVIKKGPEELLKVMEENTPLLARVAGKSVSNAIATNAAEYVGEAVIEGAAASSLPAVISNLNGFYKGFLAADTVMANATEGIAGLVSFLTKVLVSVPTLYEKYLKQENNR